MTYSLFQLLVFFDAQSHCDFKTIRDVVGIVDSTNIPDEHKRDLILQTLRQAAFLDIEYIKAMPESVRKSIIDAYQKRLDDKNLAE
jgi:hypothetical protein